MNLLLCRALIAVAALAATLSTPVAEAASPNKSGLAWFEDHWIDLAVDWENATACDVGETMTVCFRTEKELDAARPLIQSAGSVVAAAAVCASAVRLYDGISYTGNVLQLSTRNTTLNLSTHGFDNATTSFKIGGCDADFYSGSWQGGSLYPGNTSAFAQSPSMVTGWNNTISSIYIN